jgi:hypothetical protein
LLSKFATNPMSAPAGSRIDVVCQSACTPLTWTVIGKEQCASPDRLQNHFQHLVDRVRFYHAHVTRMSVKPVQKMVFIALLRKFQPEIGQGRQALLSCNGCHQPYRNVSITGEVIASQLSCQWLTSWTQ